MTTDTTATTTHGWPSLVRDHGGEYDPYGDDRQRESAGIVDLVTERARALAAVLREDDSAASLPVDTLRDRLDAARELIGAVTTFQTTTLRAFTLAGGLAEDGASSSRAWLQANAGMSHREAARVAGLGRHLDDLPATAAALASGAITAESADAIVAAVKDGRLGDAADVDASLARVAADCSPESLRAHVRRETQRVDGDAMRTDEVRQHHNRRLSITERPDGMFDITGALPHEIGITARTVLQALMTKDPKDTPDELKRSYVQRTADAFTDLCGLTLDHADLPTEAGQTRPHVAVVVDADLLAADLTDPDTGQAVAPDHPIWADLPGAISEWSDTPLSPQAALRLTCDATLTRVVMAGSRPIDVGTATRTWSAPQRTAIRVRDGGCRGPGCDRPIAWTQIHHVRWWENRGPTSVDNGLALCHHCHHRIHDLGWQVQFDPATAIATWTSPTGRTFVTRPAEPPGRRRRAS